MLQTKCSRVVIRTPDIVVGGIEFHRDSVYIIYLVFFRQLPSELAERNSTKTGYMLDNVRNLGYTLP